MFDKIQKDYITAFKEKNTIKKDVLGLLKGAILNAKIDKKEDLTEDEILSLIEKQIKLRKDSMEEYKKANKMDVVETLKLEISYLMEYMPEQLSKEEINKIIDDVFNKVNPTSQKEMGLIMKEVTPLLKGKADMKEVSTIIKEKLASL
ncbi:MAG: GatB/YqeY domain-containing protein [Bacilli bacterium]|nr:GatB/YqeY domain-containing protein [Bacilli bacterium]